MRNIVGFKVTRTRNLSNRRSIRWTHNRVRKTGWEIIWRLAYMAKLSAHEFLTRYPPSIFGEHIELETRAWNDLLVRCGINV